MPPTPPAVRPPMTIYAISNDQLDQLWFTTNKGRARAVASLISRIAPFEFETLLQIVDTDLPRQYLSGVEPNIIDRRPQWGQRNQPYTGRRAYSTIDKYEGRGQQFTVAEKQRTYHTLKTHIHHDNWILLSPLAAMQALPRTDLPPGRAFKKMMKEHHR
jgi:hypothetical protein